MSERFLEMKGVNKTFGGVKALNNVDFCLNQGEVHCLVGQNGSGKSTLIKIIAGVIKADAGSQYLLLDQGNNTLTEQGNYSEKISVIFQDLSLFPNLTIAENIAVHCHVKKKSGVINWKSIKETAQTALDRIQVRFDLDMLVEELSIADRQLVAIARAIATNAELIIMDEPTSSLTRKEVNILFGIIRELQQKSMTVLFVSHKLDEIVEIAERITVLRDGVNVGTFDRGEIDDMRLAYYISGKEISYKQDFYKPEDVKTLLKIENLTRAGHYQDVSFDLKKGEVLGIVGLLGSGRTELALSIFGMNPPSSGKILINGKEVSIKSNRDAIKNKIAYVPEDRLLQGLVINQSVEKNITLTVIKKLRSKARLVNIKKVKQTTKKWIEELNIKSATPTINASAMSGGNQQKIVIAKWLEIEPSILILDQPTNGIDVAAKKVIYDIIAELARRGLGIIIISDEAQEIYYNCSRCLVMHKGRIKEEIFTTNLSEKEFYKNVL